MGRIVSSRGVTIALALVAVVILGGYGLVAYRAIPPQPNIFAEIYADTEKNYHRYPTILQIQTATQEDSGFLRSGPKEPEYQFRESLQYFYDVSASFYFDDQEFLFKFWTYKKNGIIIIGSINYSTQERILTRDVVLDRDGDDYLNTEYVRSPDYKTQVLRDAGITRADLDEYYRIAIEDYILTEWVKLHGSDFSPTDYGEITIVDEWDRYFEQEG